MMMKKEKKNYLKFITILLGIILVLVIGVLTVRYPATMKNMFVQSSLNSMYKKQNESTVYINENVKMNYEEIFMLSGIIEDELDGTDNYSDEILSIMKETQENSGFTNIGLIKKDSPHMFAMITDGSRVQLDTWTFTLDYGQNDVSIELQTSPFESADDGQDMVVYRYNLQSKDGTEYMLIAEKPQETLNHMLDLEAETDGLTMVVRNNGNVVYGNGMIEGESIKSYNIYALLEKLQANEEQINEIRTQFEGEESGRFTLTVADEPYYFMFHRIDNTGWIVLNGYSETAMAGENLGRVNAETLKIVIIVACLLISALIFSLIMLRNNMQRESDARLLQTEKLFEEMSSHIPMSFAILVNGQKEPVFVSRNFYENINTDHFDFSMDGIREWCGNDISEDMVKKLHEEGHCELTINKNEKYFAFGIYSIGNVNNQDHFVIIFNDITDDMNGRKLLESSMKQAAQASAFKTQFLSKMSHEIRTPLNSVIGFSTLAMDGWDTLPNEELKDYMSKIRTSGNYLLELVSDILDVSRIEEGRMEINKSPYQLDALINEITDSFTGQMKRKNLQFIVDKNYKDVVLDMDSYHIKQILNNLISNAYKYTEDGGVVGFEISAKQLDEKQMNVQFVIQDTGIGMTPEFAAKIFEPFTQEDRGMMMKKQLRGSGLGMSICKNLVDMLNGTIKVESEIGEGSCFTVSLTFDVVDEEMSKTIEMNKSQNVDYSCLEGIKLLVVDDIEMNRLLIKKVLDKYKILYDEAANGKEAVEKFSASAENEYFGILMDVNMPIMNGHEATEAIRAMERLDAKNVMIAGMTADAFSEDVNKALMCGMNYHISKPVKIERVLAVLMETYEKKAGKGNE